MGALDGDDENLREGDVDGLVDSIFEGTPLFTMVGFCVGLEVG